MGKQKVGIFIADKIKVRKWASGKWSSDKSASQMQTDGKWVTGSKHLCKADSMERGKWACGGFESGKWAVDCE